VSQFEFVSVALALVYSFAIARTLAALPWVIVRERRYWLHALWSFLVLFALAVTWWEVWSLREVEWNFVRFAWALAIPALIYLRVGILVSQDPSERESWREYFYSVRIPFFAIGLAITTNVALIPWVMGVVPWFSFAPAHVATTLVSGLYIVGMITARPGIQATIALLNLVFLLSFGVASTTMRAAIQ
jgi:hypothetical protein